MFKAKSIQTLGWLIASLVPASLAHGALILQNANIDSVFAFTAGGGPDTFVGNGSNNSPILLPEFNPALGTLTDVQLLYTVQVATSTQVLNFTLFLQPPFGTPVPDPVQVFPTVTTTVALNVSGVPIVSTVVPTASSNQIVPYGTAGVMTSVAVANGSTSPDFLLNAFRGLGYVPLTLSNQDFLELDALSLMGGLTAGSLIVDPTEVMINGNIQAFYTYTPLTTTLAPEPTYRALSALVFVGVLLRRKRKLLGGASGRSGGREPRRRDQSWGHWTEGHSGEDRESRP
jgi:hypothetical protein